MKTKISIKLTLATAIVIIAPFLAASALAADEKTPAAAQATHGSDKVDLKKLEDKYWSAKDDDYGVIQNRTFSKASKFYGSLVYGPLMNDTYSKGRATGGMLGYYLTEDFGIELSYLTYSTKQNDTVDSIFSLGGAPSYSFLKNNKTISLSYTPFYAKMAFMNRAILYFDMGFTLGVGTTDYEIQKVLQNGSGVDVPSNETKSAPHVEIGVMQQLFINKNVAFRLDIKNTFYSQKVQQYKPTIPTSEASRTESTKNANDTTITFGLTLFTN